MVLPSSLKPTHPTPIKLNQILPLFVCIFQLMFLNCLCAYSNVVDRPYRQMKSCEWMTHNMTPDLGSSHQVSVVWRVCDTNLNNYNKHQFQALIILYLSRYLSHLLCSYVVDRIRCIFRHISFRRHEQCNSFRSIICVHTMMLNC
jgi:hypothetical protein